MAYRAYKITRVDHEKTPAFTSNDRIFEWLCNCGCVHDNSDFVVVRKEDIDAALDEKGFFDNEEIKTLKQMKKELDKKGTLVYLCF